MKKLEFSKILFVSLVLIGAVAVSSCGGKKKITQNDLGTEVITPCNDDEFPTSKTHFRATGTSESTDLSMAKRKATTDARANLAAVINTTIKTVTDRYSNERQVGNAQEFEEKFESLTREVVNQEMNNVAIACSKTLTKDGKYKAFIAVEVAKDELLANIKDRISKDQKLQLDYDKMKFEQIFNQEMDKMAGERP
jgi:hypothetical protein